MEKHAEAVVIALWTEVTTVKNGSIIYLGEQTDVRCCQSGQTLSERHQGEAVLHVTKRLDSSQAGVVDRTIQPDELGRAEKLSTDEI